MEPFAEILSNRLKCYIDQRHGSNIRQAAHFLGAEYSTVYRLYNGIHKSVSFFVGYDLLRQIAPNEYQQILGEYFADEMRSLEKLAKDLSIDPMAVLNQRMASVLQTETSFMIHVMTSDSKKKITVADIRDELGRFGRSELERLVAEGVLVINHNHEIENSLAGTVRPSLDLAKLHAGHYLRNINLLKPGSRLENIHGYLNAEGIRKFYEALMEAFRTLNSIIDDEALKGDQVMLCSLFCGPLTTPAQQEG